MVFDSSAGFSDDACKTGGDELMTGGESKYGPVPLECKTISGGGGSTVGLSWKCGIPFTAAASPWFADVECAGTVIRLLEVHMSSVTTKLCFVRSSMVLRLCGRVMLPRDFSHLATDR